MKTRNSVSAWLTSVCLALLLLVPSAAFAAVYKVEAVGEWIMENGLDEDVNVVRDRALEKAMRNAAFQVGARVDGSISTQNHKYIAGENEIRASKTLKVNNQQYTQETVEEGVLYRCHIVAMVDDAELQALSLGEKDIKQAIQLNHEKDELNNAMKEYGRQMRTASTETQRTQIRQQVKANENKFVAIQLAEKARDLIVYSAQREQGRQLCRQAIAKDSQCVLAYRVLAISYCLDNQLDKGYAVIKEGLPRLTKKKDLSDLGETAYQLYLSYGRKDKSVDSDAKMNQLLDICWPSKRTCYGIISRILRGQYIKNNPEKAMGWARKLLDRDPIGFYGDYYKFMAEIYCAQGDYQEALSFLDDGISNIPQGASLAALYKAKMECFRKMEDFDQVTETYQEGLAAVGTDSLEQARLHNAMGSIYRRMKQIEESKACFEMTVSLLTDVIRQETDKERLVSYYRVRGNAYNGLRQKNEASRDREKASELESQI